MKDCEKSNHTSEVKYHGESDALRRRSVVIYPTSRELAHTLKTTFGEISEWNGELVQEHSGEVR